jgi:integrase
MKLYHQYIFNYKPKDIYWCTADIGWVTGHSYIIYGPLSNGATTIMFEGIPNYPALSLKEARQKRNRLKREIDFIGLDEVVRELQETKLQPKRKFDNVIDEWIKIYSKGKAPATTKKTIERVNRYITPAFRGKDISKTSIKEIYNLLGKVEKPTAEKLKSILNGIFSYAISKEYTKHNIIKDIDLNQIFQTTIKTNSHYSFITELEEIKTYFRALDDLKDRTIVKGAIKIIWLTALRQGSVRLIKWEHIDFDNKTLFIPKEHDREYTFLKLGCDPF